MRVIVAVAIAITVLVALWSGGVPGPSEPRITWDPRVGDLVFRASEDSTSASIRTLSAIKAFSLDREADSVVSHVGIVVAGPEGYAVAEATPFGSGVVRFTPIEDFVSEQGTTLIAVRRHVHSDRFDAELMNRLASSFRDANVGFDWRLDMADSRKLYCSELVLRILASSSRDGNAYRDMVRALSVSGEVLTPNAMLRWENFTTVGAWKVL